MLYCGCKGRGRGGNQETSWEAIVLYMVGVAGEQGGCSEGVEKSLWSEYSLKV